jgi:hypothetical protein
MIKIWQRNSYTDFDISIVTVKLLWLDTTTIYCTMYSIGSLKRTVWHNENNEIGFSTINKITHSSYW